MSETHYNDPAELAPQSSPGELLKREREKQGLSREEVASALNLRPAVVDGLESDSYDEVPVATYRRGYLRAYSRLLGIDDRSVIEAYNARFGNIEGEHRVTPVHVTKPPSRLGAWLFKLATLIVIAGLVGLTLLWWQSRGGNDLLGIGGNEPVAVDTLDGTPVTEEPEPAGEMLPPLPDDSNELGLVDDEAQIEPGSDVAVDSERADVAPSSINDEEETSTAAITGDRSPSPSDAVATLVPDAEVDMAPETESEASVAEPSAEPAEEAPAEAVEEAAADPRTLELTFNEQSWTEIFDANDNRIFVGLQESGTQATAEGQPPFRLTIGNATGVELRYRGEIIDLGSRAGSNNVARFTLGE
ncbi:hypothetical protein GCM10007160_22200 [Litchfieldella qijiaojingensis]|uniref:HTH cro/C1-type domain-containing protein n=1 Tax=Litchfieldella qijiaojingensis TaxID=980347 RepID=A0ABQ2YSY1_9GAMM|nr:RodZ domain-containing protein [Halomonas qijiaojingensis]GGX94164.1 hypothetical protein GCM10007160_22200 [Halomonas qijiaojingensis]